MFLGVETVGKQGQYSIGCAMICDDVSVLFENVWRRHRVLSWLTSLESHCTDESAVHFS